MVIANLHIKITEYYEQFNVNKFIDLGEIHKFQKWNSSLKNKRKGWGYSSGVDGRTLA